ncbi:adenosylmethionine decarboxylase [Paenibacillus puerhi]|uniref:adenosylmethionine decarboxylase n=1 Tax=Paenibacillus puerhi TaxID=2692622 RepID=UPI00135835CE|nr:adenosylmethionine decarboxylase [Paenibacillus puerhi]
MEYDTYGRHVAVDAWGIDYDKLNETNRLSHHMVQAAEAGGATVLSFQAKQFKPQGATVLVLLSESHMSIHTYPEKGFAALDCYTCGQEVDPQAAIEAMLRYLEPQVTSQVKVVRGTGPLDVTVSQTASLEGLPT